jgi:transglutaminase-like putative cysteine protease
MNKLLRLEEGWITLVFLLCALVVAGWVLVSTEWTQGLDVVPIVGAGGLAAGLFLGWSVFQGWICHLVSAVYGLTWVGFLLGRGLPGGLTWGERITELAARFFYWLHQGITGGQGRDTLIFVMLLSWLFWILGYSAAWNTYRRMRPWRAILPPAIVALVNIYYYVGPAPMMRYLVLYLFFALLYVARAHAFEQEEIWRRERMGYDPGSRLDFLRAGLVLTLVVLTIAWTLPSAAAVPRLAATWRRLSDPWRTVQEEWQRLFYGLRRSVVGVVEPFGSSLTLGGPRDVKEILLMDVAAPREGRYYWRGAVYSYYRGDRWEAVEKERILLIPGRQPPGMAEDALRRPVVQTVTSYAPGRHILVGASQPVSLDREAEAYIDLTDDAPLEFIRIFSVLPLEAGEDYVVTSLVSDADATSLRGAGTDYPDWIRQSYLQLPGSLPDRVRLLAEEITAEADNPYDKAIALEQYLRDTFTYELSPPDAPEGQDYVDFLLFESQQSYCSGYATTMAVMARSLGIPARLAVGYGEGEYDPERSVFRVRENNAHSWPEIYFPGYGWVEFEPTASEIPLIRPELPEGQALDEHVPRGAGQMDEGAPEDQDRLGPGSDEGLEWDIESLDARRGPPVWLLALGSGLFALALAGWWAAENWGLRRLPAVEKAYARLLRFGRWLGRPLRISDTPFEWARDVSEVVPEAREPIGRIADLYVRTRFAHGAPANPEAKAAWKQARPALWRSWLKRLAPFSKRHGA